MKSTGIVRRLDELGRIVLPKELRRTLQIKEGEPLEIYVDGAAIVIKKYNDVRKCTFCGKESTQLLCNKGICDNCIKTLKFRWED